MRRRSISRQRYAAWAAHTPGGPHRAPRRRAVPRAAQARLHEARAGRSRRRGTASRRGSCLATIRCASATASRSTDPGTDLVGGLDQAHYCIWCHEQGKDSCARGLPEKKPSPGERAVQEVAVQRDARRLSAGRAHLRVPQAARGRRAGGRARDDLRRQPDGRRHRPPHLQRLHEVVHLPEAGSGRHSAVGDAAAEGRARAAVGLRDLFAAHALESAQPAPPAARARAPASAC